MIHRRIVSLMSLSVSMISFVAHAEIDRSDIHPSPSANAPTAASPVRRSNPWRKTYVGVSPGSIQAPCSLRIEYDADYNPEEMTLSTIHGNFSVAVDVSGDYPPLFHRTLSFHRQPSLWHRVYDRIAYQEDRYTGWKLLNTPVIMVPLAAGWRLETYLIAKGQYESVVGIQNVFPAIRGLRTYHHRIECENMRPE